MRPFRVSSIVEASSDVRAFELTPVDGLSLPRLEGGAHVDVELSKGRVQPSNDHEFIVELARTGIELPVPRGRSILEVVRAAGVEVDASCEQGVCGTCLTRVLDGVVDHRDLYLMDSERCKNDKMTICVSRSKSPRLRIEL
jgi:vanillate O-demethylase ferredoxin subunit